MSINDIIKDETESTFFATNEERLLLTRPVNNKELKLESKKIETSKVTSKYFENKACKLSLLSVMLILGTLLLIFIGLIIVGTLFDLKISKTLAFSLGWNGQIAKVIIPDKTSIINYYEFFGGIAATDYFSQISSLFLSIPVFIILMCAFGILYTNAKGIKNGFLKYFTKSSMFILGVLASVFAMYSVFFPNLLTLINGLIFSNNYYNLNDMAVFTKRIVVSLVVFVILSIFLMIFINLAISKMRQLIVCELLRWSLIVIVAFVINTLIIHIFNSSFSRMPYNYYYAISNTKEVQIGDKIMSGSNFADKYLGGFYAWYYGARHASSPIFNALFPFMHNTYGYSQSGFMSTVMGFNSIAFCSIIILPFLSRAFNANKAKYTVWVLGIMGMILTLFSELVSGNAYLSSITWSWFISTIILILMFIAFAVGAPKLNEWSTLTVYSRKD